ncbi:GNAT family N-acetyltransferase [Glutamicibacter arilaitensis]|uniref:GNAT family N-acetyltransferase n=1 Tax=Glutamicibacter arilaitensis TaxID=256701 RepID=UPI00384F4BE6
MDSQYHDKPQQASSEPLSVRPWTGIEEVPELLDVWRSSVEGRLDFLSASDVTSVASTLETVYARRSEVFVANLGARVVGFMAMDEQSVALLWVHHEHRQLGIGRALANFALSRCADIEMVIGAQNAAGLEFYKRCGFEPAGQADHSTADAKNPRMSLRHASVREQPVER